MHKRVVVIGSGPAGLLATHAAVTHGAEVTILSDTDKPSMIHGASYLHHEIPDLRIPAPDYLRYIHLGSPEEYSAKIYGPDFDHKLTSWHRFQEGEAKGWNLRAVYEQLWHEYSHLILVTKVTPAMTEWLVNDFWLAVNTAPLKMLVEKEHQHSFKSEAVSIGPSPEPIHEGWIAYVGVSEIPWYRESNLWGVATREYPLPQQGVLGEDPDLRGPCQTVFKPVSYEGHHLSGVLKVGRYGAWDKQALSDDAYFKVKEAMEL